MKLILKLAILLFAVSASAATYPNKFVTNANPESVAWTNTAAAGINASFAVTAASVHAPLVHSDTSNLQLNASTGVAAGLAIDESGGTNTFLGVISGNGAALTTLAGSQVQYRTNANAVTVDFTLPYSLLSTNAAFAFLTPSGVDTTKLLVQTAVIFVTNTTASAVAVTMPANVHSQGTLFVTNATTFTFTQYAQKFTNCVALPLW